MSLGEPRVDLGEPRVDPILMEAARLIREDGWIQGESHTANGYCITGAIAEAVKSATKDIPSPRERHAQISNLWARTIRRMGVALRVASLPAWNDRPERTKEEVLKRLEDAAIRREVKNEAGRSLELASTTGTAP